MTDAVLAALSKNEWEVAPDALLGVLKYQASEVERRMLESVAGLRNDMTSVVLPVLDVLSKQEELSKTLHP